MILKRVLKSWGAFRAREYCRIKSRELEKFFGLGRILVEKCGELGRFFKSGAILKRILKSWGVFRVREYFRIKSKEFGNLFELGRIL